MDERKKVLIVEDEAMTALMLEGYVEDKGFLSVGLAATGEDAVIKARSTRPDLVFMDFTLGGAMNGVEAAKIIHAELQIPVVIMSGHDEQLILDHARHYRPLAFLRKPMSDAALDAILNQIA